MSPVIAAIFVGGITYLGRVARDKPMSINVVVGVGGLALGLAMLEQVNRDLAQKFAILAIVGTLLAHWQVIVKASGLKA